ncbi:TonB-dependent receptor associated with cobalamin uptake [Desulfosarcina variabilis str. Montpellier]
MILRKYVSGLFEDYPFPKIHEWHGLKCRLTAFIIFHADSHDSKNRLKINLVVTNKNNCKYAVDRVVGAGPCTCPGFEVGSSSKNRKEIPNAVTLASNGNDIDNLQQTVVEVLNDVPGVVINTYGPPGGADYFYIRGAGNGQTIVMIDGVRVQDPSSTTNALSIANLRTDNIERIEVVRVAKSVLYGSSAMGGVVNIITKRWEGKPKLSAGFEGGSYSTFKENAALSGGTNRIDYSLQATRTDTGGLSRADSPDPQEIDYYDNTTIAGNLNGRITDRTEAGITAYYVHSNMDYDESPDPDTGQGRDAYPALYSDMLLLTAHLDQEVTDWWNTSVKVGNTDADRDYFTEAPEIKEFLYSYTGNTKTASWQNDFFLGDTDTLTAGFDYLHETGSYEQGTSAVLNDIQARTKSLFIHNLWMPLENVNISVGLRYDDHQNFGSHTTYRAGAAYLFETLGTKIRGSYGTGFRAPSVLQLYYPVYGNQDLQPEESEGVDIGIDQNLFNDMLTLSVTYFHNDIEDMIGTDNVGGVTRFYNVASVKTTGVETTLSWRPHRQVTLNLHYTYQDSEDESIQQQRTHIPYHTGGGSINYSPTDKFNWNVSAQYMGERYAAKLGDRYPIVSEQLVLGTAASYDVTKWLELTARISNLTDLSYQSMYGYTAPGIGFYGGFNLTF